MFEIFNQAAKIDKINNRLEIYDATIAGHAEALKKKNEEILLLQKDIEVLSIEKNELQKRLNREISKVDAKIMTLEKDTDEKIYGVFKSIDLKITNATHEEKKKTVVDLMSRIAELEGLKDAIEHRRSTAEVIEKKKKAEELVSKLDREDQPTVGVKAQIKIIEWVLGGE